MRRLTCILVTGALVVGCAAKPTSERTIATPPQAPPPPTDTKEPPTISVDHGALAPFFERTTSALRGTFVVRGEDLFYIMDGARSHVLKGSQPAALAADQHRALVSDGQKLSWFDPATGALETIPDLPPVQRAVVRGSAYLLAAQTKVLRWSPGSAAVELPSPDHVRAVYGISISPDGRYGVVAYDLDIPGGPLAGVIWAYDLVDGTVRKWPSEEPKVMYGLWLLGWSGPATVRFMTGVRGYNVGHTWALPDGDPGARDGAEYTVMEDAWPSRDGAWVAYRTAVESAVVQSAQPDSRPIRIYRDASGLDYVRILLNGNLAFRTRNPAAWWEVTREGAAIRHDDADLLY